MASDLVHASSVATSAASGWREGSRSSVALADQALADQSMNESSFAQRRKDAKASVWLRDLVELTKPRIVTMILVTTACTAIIGAGGGVGFSAMGWLLLATAMVAAAAGSANQIWERDLDRQMPRTASRPLPAERMGSYLAAFFSTLLLAAGLSILTIRFSPAPAIYALATWVIYVLIYTPLKTRTTLNTAVGAIAGALPVMIGYTATGGDVDGISGWLLFTVLAAWQFPHFMAIAWMYRGQYAQAGFKMTPSVHPSGRSAAIQSIVGSVVLMATAVALVFFVAPPTTTSAMVYAAAASATIIVAVWPMLSASMRFASQRTDASARRLLRSSLLVLPVVLLVVTVGVWF